MNDEIRLIAAVPKSTGRPIYMIEINGRQFAVTPFTVEERLEAERLEKQVRSSAEHIDLMDQIRDQAFELIRACAQRANPSTSREMLQELITPERFGAVFDALKDAA